MICSKAVYNVHVLPKSILVIFGAEDRPYFSLTLANISDVLVTEEEMVRGDFTCHRETLFLGSTNHCNLQNDTNARW